MKTQHALLTRADFFPHQLRAIEFVKKNQNCALNLDVGLGKTSIGLTAYLDLCNSFDAGRMLVVAPLRVARKVFKDEVDNWAHLKGLRVATVTGAPAERMAALKTKADIHCINYDQLDWLYAQFVHNNKQIVRWPWDLVFADESHRLKNPSSRRWWVLNQLRKLWPRMVTATGTIMPNGYPDLWSQYYLLDRGKRLGYSIDAYLDRWFDMPQYGEHGRPVLKPGAKKQIQAAVADITLSMRAEDYMALPNVLYNPVRVTIPPAQMKVYKKFEREFIHQFGEAKIKAANTGVLYGKLLQLANGAVYSEKGVWQEFHDAKLKALVEFLEDMEDRHILIGYYFQHDLERIQTVLAKVFGHKKARVMRTTQDEDDWNEGKIDWMLVHPDSCGEGTNLHKNACQDLIWFGLTNNLMAWQQLNGRLFGGARRLAKPNGTVHYLLADQTIDGEYVDLLKDKDATQDEFGQAMSNYTKRVQ